MLPGCNTTHTCNVSTRLGSPFRHPVVYSSWRSRPCQARCRGSLKVTSSGLLEKLLDSHSQSHTHKHKLSLRCSAQQPTRAFGKGDDPWPQRDRLGIPTQADAITRGGLDEPSRGTQVQERPKPPPDIDYLQVLPVQVQLSLHRLCNRLLYLLWALQDRLMVT